MSYFLIMACFITGFLALFMAIMIIVILYKAITQLSFLINLKIKDIDRDFYGELNTNKKESL